MLSHLSRYCRICRQLLYLSHNLYHICHTHWQSLIFASGSAGHLFWSNGVIVEMTSRDSDSRLQSFSQAKIHLLKLYFLYLSPLSYLSLAIFAFMALIIWLLLGWQDEIVRHDLRSISDAASASNTIASIHHYSEYTTKRIFVVGTQISKVGGAELLPIPYWQSFLYLCYCKSTATSAIKMQLKLIHEASILPDQGFFKCFWCWKTLWRWLHWSRQT